MKYALLFLLTGCAAVAGSSTPLEDAAARLCTQVLGSSPYVYDDLFSPVFVKAVSETSLRALTGELLEATGPCDSYQPSATAARAAVYEFVSKQGNRTLLSVSVDAQGKIDSLLIRGVTLSRTYSDWAAVRSALSGWRGKPSFTFRETGGAAQSLDGDRRQPLGSGFKLYVLGALETAVRTGKAKWADELAIRDDWKSLPSGVLQDLPAGTKLTLKEYAEKMISISDNTATDHLIRRLGREAVEAELMALSNPFPRENEPFPTTAEFFKLKWAVSAVDADAYVKADAAERRRILASLAATPLTKVGTNGVPLSKPSRVNELEWFGSTDGQCASLEGLHARHSAEVDAVLAVNQPFVDPKVWKYAGFKGGSEPGVLTLSYLLQGPRGKWGCLSFAWHDELKNVNSWMAYDLIPKALALAAKAL